MKFDWIIGQVSPETAGTMDLGNSYGTYVLNNRVDKHARALADRFADRIIWTMFGCVALHVLATM